MLGIRYIIYYISLVDFLNCHLYRINIGPQINWNTFDTKSIPYQLRQGQTIQTLHAKQTRTLNFFGFCASQAWNKIPGNIKSDLSNFKLFCRYKKCD